MQARSCSSYAAGAVIAVAMVSVGPTRVAADHIPSHKEHSSHAHDHAAHNHAAHNHAAHAAPAAQPELSEASKAYEEAMQKMHRDMTVPYANDVDVDFVRGMIPHHQGAIDQAQVLLKYSKNPRLRRLAGGIIAAQKREILFMKKWLEAREKGVENDDVPDWLKNSPLPEEGSGR